MTIEMGPYKTTQEKDTSNIPFYTGKPPSHTSLPHRTSLRHDSHALPRPPATDSILAPSLSRESMSHSVLVVEDDHTTQMVICALIQSLGVKHIDVAFFGEEGIRLMKLRPYSIIFFNPLILPRMNGAECVQRFRLWEKTHRDTRQFICGIAAAVGGKSICMDSGMDDCILKVNSAIHVETLVREYVLAGKSQVSSNHSSTRRQISSSSLNTSNTTETLRSTSTQPTTSSINSMNSINSNPTFTSSTTATLSSPTNVTNSSIHINENRTSNQDGRFTSVSVSSENNPDVDIDKFRQQLLGKTGNMNNFIRLFMNQGERTMVKLRASVIDQIDWSPCQHEAHALKGSAMMMHAQPLAYACRLLERFTSNMSSRGVTTALTNSKDLESISNMLAVIETKWQKALVVLRKFVDNN